MTSFDDEEVVEGVRLAVDFRALDHIERMAGKPTPEILSVVLGSCPLTLKAQVVKGLMLRHYPDATMDQAMDLMVRLDASALFALFQRTFNVEKERPKKPSEAAWDIASFRVEWIKLGGSPSEFWRETPRSYVNAMEGMALAAKLKHELALSQAWHTAVFALTGYGGKLKDLSEYLGKGRSGAQDNEQLQNARIIHLFNSMRARGFDIKAERIERVH